MEYDPELIREAVIEEDDFGFEMRVGGILASIPTSKVEHGGTYTDGVSGKPRQFDFRVEVETGRCAFQLAVECKRLVQTSPLVIAGTFRSADEASHDVVISRSDCSGIGDTFANKAFSFVRRATGTAYIEGQFVGKSMIRLVPKKTNFTQPIHLVSAPDADIYDRWAQALSSSSDLCIRAALRNASRYCQSHPAIITAIVPVVVIPDATLWQVFYDKAGAIHGEPHLVDESTLYVGRTFHLGRDGGLHRDRMQISHMHFMTLKGLKNWASLLTQFVEPTKPQPDGLRPTWFPNTVTQRIE